MVVLRLYGGRIWFVVVLFFHATNAHGDVVDAAVRIRQAHEVVGDVAGDGVVVFVQLPLAPVVGVVDSAGMWLRLAVVFLCCRYRWWV